MANNARALQWLLHGSISCPAEFSCLLFVGLQIQHFVPSCVLYSHTQPCYSAREQLSAGFFSPLETTTGETGNKHYIVWKERQKMYLNSWQPNTYGRNMLENTECSREHKELQALPG